MISLLSPFDLGNCVQANYEQVLNRYSHCILSRPNLEPTTTILNIIQANDARPGFLDSGFLMALFLV
jgi:hypothetical protein